jgi:hypothetical protein
MIKDGQTVRVLRNAGLKAIEPETEAPASKVQKTTENSLAIVLS